MKILELRTYQPIKWHNKPETYFSLAKDNKVSLTMLDTGGAVVIDDGQDITIVTFANIAYLKPERVSKTSKPSK